MKIEWDDKYIVGIDEFDAQHKKLFETLKSIDDCTQKKLKCSMIIDDLLRLATTHFGAEEKAMQSANYPDYEAHKMEHDEITSILERLHSRYYKGNNLICKELLEIMHHWIEDHMTTTDQSYVPWLTGNGIR